MDRFGLYIHIPFCKKKCNYCDFISFSYAEEKIKKYFEVLKKEIRNSKYKNRKISTIYIGGGTPSYVKKEYIEELLKEIKNNFTIEENAEITIEINPGTVDEEKLRLYKNIGINRLSIGLQSTSDRLLKLIGRIHNYEDFQNTYKLARSIGFENINVDLIIAIPTQSLEDVSDSLKKIVSINPEHISVYSLIVEEGTKIEEMINKGELKLLDEETERKMYWNVKRYLSKYKYKHYEISNFSKKGYESKHNLDCWNQEEYLGFGIASHSYIDNKRFSNVDNIDQYINNIENEKFENNIIIHEIQNQESKAKEYMMIGLRKIDGISISEFERKFRINPLFYFRFEIEKLTKEGLIEVDLDRIKLTKKGLDLANLVFEEFV